MESLKEISQTDKSLREKILSGNIDQADFNGDYSLVKSIIKFQIELLELSRKPRNLKYPRGISLMWEIIYNYK